MASHANTAVIKKQKQKQGRLCTACGQEIKYGKVMRISFGHFEDETFTRNTNNEFYCSSCRKEERIRRVIPTYVGKVVKIHTNRVCYFCRGPMTHTMAMRKPNPITQNWKGRSDYYECQHCGAMETVDTPYKRIGSIFRGE